MNTSMIVHLESKRWPQPVCLGFHILVESQSMLFPQIGFGLVWKKHGTQSFVIYLAVPSPLSSGIFLRYARKGEWAISEAIGG